MLDGQRLVIYLDRFEDNAPVTDAQITVSINDETMAAESVANGTYTVVSKLFERGGLFELVFDIKASEGDDLLIGKLSLPAANAASALAGPTSWDARIVSAIRHWASACSGAAVRGRFRYCCWWCRRSQSRRWAIRFAPTKGTSKRMRDRRRSPPTRRIACRTDNWQAEHLPYNRRIRREL